MSIQFEQARRAYQQGQYEEAMRQFSELVFENPKIAQIRIWLGIACREAGHANEAKAQFQQALKLTDDPKLTNLARTSLAKLENIAQNETSQKNASKPAPLQALTDTDLLLQIGTHPPRPEPTSKLSSAFLQLPFQGWRKLSIQWKLITLLITVAAVPVVVVTQTIVAADKEYLLDALQGTLQQQGSTFTDEYVLWTQTDSLTKAESLATFVQASQVNLSDPVQVLQRRTLLQNLVTIKNGSDAESNKNFQILTDAQGRTIVQDIRVLAPNFYTNPPLPEDNKESSEQQYQPVSLPIGIELGDIPIVENALKTGRSLDGVELIKGDVLQRLGLEKQAQIDLEAQPAQGSPGSNQPSPTETYNLDQGRAGLVGMAVYPIKINDQLVGTVIVGTVLNKNYGLVDQFAQDYNVPIVSVFAQDRRINTNILNADGKTRTIGTQASQEIAADALNQGQESMRQTNILGKQYLTFARPLYDHQKELNPSQAKPVGIAFVGQSLAEVESYLTRQQLTGYIIGGGVLLLASLIIIPVANSFSRPLRRLASFAQRIGSGEPGVRLGITKRQDEIGILFRELNEMAASIESNLGRLQQQEASITAQNDDLQNQLVDLLSDIEGASRGDLTVYANVTEGEIGTVADFFNAVVESLRRIVIQVKRSAAQVNVSLGENEGAARQLADEALGQAVEITRTLDSVEKMALSIQEVAESARQAAEVARVASTTAEVGGKAIDRTVQSILSLRETVAETAKKVKRLGESSQQISKIISLINQIALQTNLLAINAGIEAARAGEEGRGFAVVAEEVGALAAQSAAATKEIEEIVENIQLETRDVVEAMEIGTAQVVEGTHLVGDTKENLEQILKVSHQIDQLVQSISSATVSQTKTAQIVSSLMKEIAKVSEQTSDSSRQISVSLKQTVETAQQLQSSVGMFKISADTEARIQSGS